MVSTENLAADGREGTQMKEIKIFFIRVYLRPFAAKT
jgi:hypothetical protein